jgi:hypothetical protein
VTAPRRHRVMSPQTRAALGLPPAAGGEMPAVEDRVVAADNAGLAVTMRVQRNLAFRTMAMLLGALILVPLVLAGAPVLVRLRVGSVPLSWLVLGVAFYPLLLLLAVRHRRAVDRLEAALAARQARGSD